MNNVIVEKRLVYILLSNSGDFACHIGKLECIGNDRDKCFEMRRLILLEFGM